MESPTLVEIATGILSMAPPGVAAVDWAKTVAGGLADRIACFSGAEPAGGEAGSVFCFTWAEQTDVKAQQQAMVVRIDAGIFTVNDG